MIHHLQHIVDLVEICSRKSIKHVVVSPGSRNAALIKLFSSRSEFQLHSIVDERSAAFYGLGIALANQEPVALLCTSGTAVLNYAPALAEAYYQRVPLVALTADRPEHLIDQQDNQTIRQVNVFQNHIKESVHLHQPIKDKDELEIQHQAISKTLDLANSGIKGPVHINIPIAEPFYIELPPPTERIDIKRHEGYTKEDYSILIEAFQNAKRPMVICGEGNLDASLNKSINHLASNTIVLAEPISNIKGKNIVAAVDRTMMQIETLNESKFIPDLLISFGGPVVSKRLKQWLQQVKQVKHYRIAEATDSIDTYQNLTQLVTGDPRNVFEIISKNAVTSDENYLFAWRNAFKKNTDDHQQIKNQLPYSDFTVFSKITDQLFDDSILHLGNSSPVRYGQLFDLSKCAGVYSNRGVSGIDGCLSTAAGFSSQSNKSNLLITGDLSFLYDSNGLWNHYFPKNLKIIVINNEGGGIFRLIPGPSDMDSFEAFMETKHPVDLEKLVAAYGIEYEVCQHENELQEKIQHFLGSNNGPSLLEIKTPRLKNAEVYLEYINRIKNL